jgi:two-component system chemotaxis response regulator CheB
MARKRILLVDDSVVVRKLVAEILAQDPEVESVVTASNGRLALDKLDQVNPDLVILDVEMPEMDGIATLKAIRERSDSLPVLMFSGLTERAGSLTLDALALGASDYVTKPAQVGALVPLDRVREELVSKTRALLARRVHGSPPLLPKAPAPMTPPPWRPPARVELLVIGASTGGPNAIAQILSTLPGEFPVPIVIAQHMPPLFTKMFAERLDSQGSLRVREATSGGTLEPGTVWLAPGDFHVVVQGHASRMTVHVHQGPPENSCRPSVDVLFRSAAEVYGPGVLGVVLTGMGMDGLRGAERIREAGGQMVVQDEATSVVWSMPGSVALAGLANKVVALDHMGAELLWRTQLERGATRAAP